MPSQRKRNRFSRHPLLTTVGILVVIGLVSEGASQIVIVALGHQNRLQGYSYNRMVSGYTVFKNTPHYDMGSSTIKERPSDANVRFDQNGFVTPQPLSEEKPADTFRVFVLGGSTAFGAGQNAQFHGVHSYPDGVYTYRLSIAGYLREYLEKQLPGKKIEVVTAAAYRRMFHQSVILYLSTISRFDPDVVVHVEGWNDNLTFVEGRPYDQAEKLLPELIALRERSESLLRKSRTLYVATKAYDRFLVSRRDRHTDQSPPPPVESWDDYIESRPKYIQNARRFEQMISQYLAILDADQTQCVFVLQPILTREDPNKKFSEIERQLLRHALALEGRHRDELLVQKYFFTDYLTDRLDGMFQRAEGATFIDGNRELASLNSDDECYVDYCHLLPKGNRVLAESIGRRIVDQLSAAGHDAPSVP